MTSPSVLVDLAAPVSTLTVNRPHVLNAIDGATIDALAEAFAATSAKAGVCCIIVTGAGDRAFAAGADVAAMAGMDERQAGALSAAGHRLAAAMARLPAPIIAAVNGFALGGGLELALACDFMVASSKARLGLPETSVGVIPGFGGVARLARRVGVGLARELIYTGRQLTAEEALRIGLVNEITEPQDLMPRARAIAQTIATRAPLAVAAAKRALHEGADMSLGQALDLERELFAGLFGSADQKEGMRAFLDKRPPVFRGR